MRSLIKIVITGILLADGVIALFAAYKLFRVHVFGARTYGILMAGIALHLGFLAAAVQELAPPRDAEFGIYLLISLVMLAVGIWPAAAQVMFSRRMFFATHMIALIDDVLPDGLVVSEFKTGKIIFVNRKLEAISGYDRTELIGESVDLLVPQESKLKHMMNRQDYYREPVNRPMGSGSFALRKKGGDLTQVAISLGSDGSGYVMAAVREQG